MLRALAGRVDHALVIALAEALEVPPAEWPPPPPSATPTTGMRLTPVDMLLELAVFAAAERHGTGYCCAFRARIAS